MIEAMARRAEEREEPVLRAGRAATFPAEPRAAARRGAPRGERQPTVAGELLQVKVAAAPAERREAAARRGAAEPRAAERQEEAAARSSIARGRSVRRLRCSAASTSQLGALSLSADELELLYTSGLPGSTRGFYRTTRANRQAGFELGEPLPELDAACDPSLLRSGDLSADGRRFYFVCYATLVGAPTELFRATRSGAGATFSVESMRFGEVQSSPGLFGDELSLVTSPATMTGPPLVYTRSGVNEPFAESFFPLQGSTA